MMEQNWTEEPITFVDRASKGASAYDDGGDYSIRDRDGMIIAETFARVAPGESRPARATAKRLVVCYNACADLGLDPAAEIERLRKIEATLERVVKTFRWSDDEDAAWVNLAEDERAAILNAKSLLAPAEQKGQDDAGADDRNPFEPIGEDESKAKASSEIFKLLLRLVDHEEFVASGHEEDPFSSLLVPMEEIQSILDKYDLDINELTKAIKP